MKTKSTEMSAIARQFKTQTEIAKTINRSRVYVNQALNGKRQFTRDEIELIRNEISRRISA